MSTSAVEQPKCPYCGSLPHQGVCPSVKAIEYHEDGRVKRVEFKTATDYPVFPAIDYTNPKFTAAQQPDPTIGQTYMTGVAINPHQGR